MANPFDNVVDLLDQPQQTGITPPEPSGLSEGAMPKPLPVAEDDPQKDARRAIVQTNIHNSMDTPGDSAAANLKLAEQQGVPPETVARNRQYFEKRQKLAEIDFGTLIDANPQLGQELEDQYFAAASHDDLQNLSTIETWMRAGRGGFSQGRESSRLNRAIFARNMSPVETPQLDATIERMKARASNVQEAEGFAGWIQSAAQFAGQIEMSFEAGAAGAAGGAVAGAALGAPAGGVGAIPGAGAGAVAGFGYGFMSDLIVTSMGESFSVMEDVERETGVKLDPAAKYSIASGVGLLNAAIERVSLGLLAKPMQEATRRIVNRAVAEKMQSASFRAAALKFGKAYGGAVATNTLQEGLQTVTNAVGADVAARISYDNYQGLLEDPAQFRAMVDDALNSMESAFKGSALIGLPGPGFNYAHDVYNVQKSTANQAALRMIATGSQESSLAKRLPERFEQFVQRVRERAGPAGVENVYIPAQEFATYFQSQGKNGAVIASELGLADQYQQAIESGGDLVVPMETVAGKLALTEYYQGLEPFMRIAPDDMSLADIKNFNPQDAQAQQEANDARTAIEQADRRSSSDQVFSQVYAQRLNTTGNPEVARHDSTIISAIYDTLAARSSVKDPMALLNRFGLTIQNTLPVAVKKRVDVIRRAQPIDRAQQVELMAEVSPQARQFVADAAAIKQSLNTAPAPQLDVNNPRAVSKATGIKATSLFTRIDQLGGVNAGQLSAQELANIKAAGGSLRAYDGELGDIWDGDPKLRSRFVRRGGMSPDELARTLGEEGYFGAEFTSAANQNGPSVTAGINELFNAMKQEAGGQRVYPMDVRDAVAQFQENPNEQAEYDRFIQALGISAESTVPEIAEALAKQAAETGQNLEASQQLASAENTVGPEGLTDEEWNNIFFQSGVAKELSPQFKAWFEGSKAVDENGNPLVLYHGAQRSDRVVESGKFDKTRANSGPMQFFTDDPNIASNYANGKADTSLDASELEKFFTINGVAGDLDKAWASLPATVRVKIRADGYKVAEDADTGAIGFTEDGLTSEQHYRYMVNAKNEGNGNPLRALYKLWIEGGTIFNEEGKFTDVLKALGVKAEYDNPYAVRSGVIPVFLSIKNPLDTTAIPENVVSELEAASKNAPEAQPAGFGVDMWDKRHVPADEWIAELKNDISDGKNSFAWTRIPDWVTAKLKEMGYDGIKDFGGKMNDGRTHSVWVPFEETQIKSVFNKGTFNGEDPNILNQEQKDKNGQLPGLTEPRGSIRFMEDPNVQGAFKAVISLGPKANLSTFLHETGHLGLEMMRYLVKSGDADESLTNDLNALVEWFGVKDADAIGRAEHEKFAETFEVYLREGRAPSLRLHDAFNRFRVWLTRIYRNLTGMGVELNDDVRGIMDRLLATDEEIAQARSLDRFAADPEVMKLMTDAEASAYKLHIQRAVDYAGEQVMKMALGEAWERRGKPYMEEMARVRAEVEAEVNKQPVYKAIEWLAGGKWIDGEQPEGLTHQKLNRASLVDDFGEGILKSLPKAFGHVYTKEGGITADEAAVLFGFANGEEMVKAMVRADGRKKVIEERTKGIMNERHGDVMNDGSIEREALETLHNEHRARAIAAELRALAKSAKKEPSVNAYSRQVAKDFVGRQKYMNISAYNRFYRAEVKAAKEAQEAMLKGDKDAALKAKQRQLLNHFLFMEARNATQEVDKNVRHFKRLLKARPARSIDPDYLDQIENMLARFNFASLSQPEIARRKRLAAFITEKQAEDVILTIPEKLRDEAFRQSYRDMTVEDIRGLFDAVTNLEHNGRLKRKLIIAGQEREREKVKADIMKSLEENGLEVRQRSTQNETTVDKLVSGAKSMDASLLRVEDLARALDGNKELGPVHQAIYGVLADANSERWKLMKDVSDKVQRLIHGGSMEQKKRWMRWYDVQALGKKFKGTDLLALALNQGNDGNRERVLKGEGWRQEQVDEALKLLTKEDWDVVQGIWDLLGDLQPKIEQVVKDQTGLKFEKVKSRPVETEHGTYRGGYYPIVYDKSRSYDAYVSEQQSVVRDDGTGALFEKSPILPEVERGFTQSRGEKGLNAPMLLSLDILPSHLDKVIHYITMAAPVKQVDSLIRDKDIRNGIISSVGMEQFRIIRPWLAAVARGTANDEKVDVWQKTARWLRTGTTTTVLSFKVISGVKQFLGLSPVAGQVGAANTLHGVTQLFNPDQWRYAFEASKILEHRAESFDRDVATVMRNLNRASDIQRIVGKFGMSFIAYAQLTVDTATWHAAHIKWMKEHPMDEDGAIRYADSIVRRTQGSGEVLDLIAFQRGNEFQKLYSTFYTPFAVIFNAVRSASRGKMGAEQAFAVAHAVFWTVSLPAIAEVLIEASTGGSDADDPEAFLKEMALRHITNVGGAIPIARDLVTAATEGRQGGSAIANFTTQGGILLRDVLTGDIDEKTLKKLVYVTSVLSKVPLYNPYKSAEHAVKAATGESEFSVGDLLQGERGR